MDTSPESFGLHRGEEVRFRRGEKGKWILGRIDRIERDGSIGITDRQGAARAIRIEHVEIQTEGPRGGRHWEPLLERLSRAEQLELF